MMKDLEELNTFNKTFLIVNHEQRFEIFFNSFIFFAILNCIALLVLLIISCLVSCLWFMMLLCCRDSAGIIEDIQDSMNEMKLEDNENYDSKETSDNIIDQTKSQTSNITDDNLK